MITVTLNDASLQGVLGKIKKYSRDVKIDVNKEVLSSALRVTADAKMNIYRNRSIKTSNLWKNITYRHIPSKYGAEVYTRVFYAEYVEEGTKPHVIKVKNAKALHFKVGGKDVFVKKVNHPGTRAKPFMQPAADKERPIYIENLKRVLTKNM
jgi:hypothetical protein